MDTCTLIPIIVGLISALLGYLLGKLAGGNNSELETQLQECKSKLANLEMENSRVANVMSTPAIVFNAGEAKAIFGRTVKENDLTIVEGIGPKIQELLHKGGIHTWKSLSETAVARCQEILDGAGSAYAVHKPGSWPEQAKFAYEGRWKELKDWQDDLDGGK